VFAFIGRWLRRLVLVCVALLLLIVLCVLLLRWVNPVTSAFMVRASINAYSEAAPYSTDYRWVDLEDISPHAAIAVIASEDQLFPFHTGFDFKSIRQAVQHNASHKRQRGASTISQQVTKNLFLWPGGGYFRKGLEAGITLLIEWLWPKERILEVSQHRRVRPRHLRRRSCLAALLRPPRAPAQPRTGRAARRRAAQSAPLPCRSAVALRTVAARLDTAPDGGTRRHQLSGRAGQRAGGAADGAAAQGRALAP
jgi:Transglycosylase